MGSKVLSRVQRFYEDKVVLVTGGTGFLGKALTEKLLRALDVRQVYLLVREKKGISPDERLQHLLKDPVFKRLCKERPGFEERVSVVSGDLQKNRLGLSETQEALLRNSVNLVLHSAASVRFNDPLKTAVSTNLTPTKQLCQLARQMGNLKAFVYVSTAFSNCDSPVIQEKIYPPSLSPDGLITLSETMEEPLLDKITPALLGCKPNTYVYTKCAAEKIVDSFKSTLPVAIVRPSIVVGAQSEPEPGWLYNEEGLQLIAGGMSRGLMRNMPIDDNAVCNIAPVDYVSNAVIAMAYSVAEGTWQNSKDAEETPVVNIVSTSNNSITWRKVLDLLKTHIRKNPSQKLKWYPFTTYSRNRWVTKVHQTILHHIPATILDNVSPMYGKPTKLKRVYERYEKFYQETRYFTTNHFTFEEKNARVLWDSLEPQDQQIFPFNMDAIQWDPFFPHFVKGCRQFLLMEDPSTMEEARLRLKVLYILHLATSVTLLLPVMAVISILSPPDLLAQLNNLSAAYPDRFTVNK